MNSRQRRAAARKAARKAAKRGITPERLAAAHDRRRLALLNRVDPLSGLRGALRDIAAEQDQWAGIPMPLSGERLVVEPRFPNAEALAAMDTRRAEERTAEPWTDGAWLAGPPRIRNRFHSTRKGCDIWIYERRGRIDWTITPAVHHLGLDLATLGCADAWGIEQEHRAIMLLGGMLRHRQLKQYLLTGMFLETSARSGVTYIFRRLRPTIAATARGFWSWRRGGTRDGSEMRILAALCLHPIAYYEGSWAGAMCPTDDVVAHLTLMRGDEAMFWRRANQHPAHARPAGL